MSAESIKFILALMIFILAMKYWIRMEAREVFKEEMASTEHEGER